MIGVPLYPCPREAASEHVFFYPVSQLCILSIRLVASCDVLPSASSLALCLFLLLTITHPAMNRVALSAFLPCSLILLPHGALAVG